MKSADNQAIGSQLHRVFDRFVTSIILLSDPIEDGHSNRYEYRVRVRVS